MPFSTYSETLDYLYRSLPMFQRVGAPALKADLTNTIKLCETLGNPQHKFKSIHVAGTNGKGSTSHMLASILQTAGYKTGLYTSPHLKEFTERIRIQGEEVDKEFVVDFVNRIQEQIEIIKPSFFEITVAMAFDYFAKQQVDIAVIEVGLGGRLDSTNVITPELSIITNIGTDHKELLGDTLEKIAYEKAGIIKEGVPVVISEFQQEINHVFTTRAQSLKAKLYPASVCFNAKWNKDGSMLVKKNEVDFITDLQLPLKGLYQQKNVPGVLQACEVLTNMGYNLSHDKIINGLQNVISQTNLKGRWQLLNQQPLIICDTGHNLEGITYVVQQIKKLPYNKLFMVWGMVKDKDLSSILTILPKEAHYIFCEPKIPRAMSTEDLFGYATGHGLKGEIVSDVNEAISRAKSLSGKDDLIFVGGSTFVVAEIENL